MEKKNLGILMVAIIAVIGAGLVSAYGFGKGFMNQNLSEEEKDAMIDQENAIRTAIQNNDFATWKSLMEEKIAQMQSGLTTENFKLLYEQHQNMPAMRENGNFTRGQGEGFGGKGMHNGMRMGGGNCTRQ
jgi:hypothetical protein